MTLYVNVTHMTSTIFLTTFFRAGIDTAWNIVDRIQIPHCSWNFIFANFVCQKFSSRVQTFTYYFYFWNVMKFFQVGHFRGIFLSSQKSNPEANSSKWSEQIPYYPENKPGLYQIFFQYFWLILGVSAVLLLSFLLFFPTKSRLISGVGLFPG